jgi:hypothetical protein
MGRIPIILSLFMLLLMPVYASAQTSDRITILENFGDYANGEPLFVYGQIANLLDDSFLIMQIFNPLAVVEAIYDDELIVSGAVQKTLAFREDLFVDVYDQRGTLIEEISLNDNSSGLFTEVVSRPFDSGVYVAQLQYHDVVVTDFFNVK